MSAQAVMVGAQVLSGVMGFKGNRAAAKAAEQAAEYNAQIEENEAVLLARARRDQEQNVRADARRLIGAQRAATAKSGVQMSGSPLQALADTYFNVERDAQRIQYAASVDAANQEAAAAMARANGAASSAAYKTAALQSLLGAVSGTASSMQQQKMFDLQTKSYEAQLAQSPTTVS